MGRHMIEHIHETPGALAVTLERNRDLVRRLWANLTRTKIERVTITGCGASYHDGVAARFAFEALGDIPVAVLPGAELARYPDHYFGSGRLVIAVSRSGEKGDVLEAARRAKACGSRILAVTATPDGLLARLAHEVVLSYEGEEHSQPKTKSFVSLLGLLILLAVNMTGRLSEAEREDLVGGLLDIPRLIAQCVDDIGATVRELAREVMDSRGVFITGDLGNFGTALEAALKLKETCGIHAEAFPTGEVTQGPMLLLDDAWTYVALASPGNSAGSSKVLAAASRLKARSVVVTSVPDMFRGGHSRVIPVPQCLNEVFSPLIFIIPMQLLAYHTAVVKGLDPDNPANFDIVLGAILEPGRYEPEMRPKENSDAD